MNITSNYKFCVREWTYVRMARRKVIIVLKFNHKCILAKMFTLIPSLFRFSCTWLVFSGCRIFFIGQINTIFLGSIIFWGLLI